MVPELRPGVWVGDMDLGQLKSEAEMSGEDESGYTGARQTFKDFSEVKGANDNDEDES